MIPNNLKKSHILLALSEIDVSGIPEKRAATKYQLIYKNKSYPPKYVISLANKYANGELLDSNIFSGGQESNSFFAELGFEIVEKHASKTRLVNKQSPFKSTIVGTEWVSNKLGLPHIRESDDISKSKVKVATVAISSASNLDYIENPSTLLKEIMKTVATTKHKPDVVLLPAGFYYTNNSAKELYQNVSRQTQDLLEQYKLNSIVCLGIDGRNNRDQVLLRSQPKG